MYWELWWRLPTLVARHHGLERIAHLRCSLRKPDADALFASPGFVDASCFLCQLAPTGLGSNGVSDVFRDSGSPESLGDSGLDSKSVVRHPSESHPQIQVPCVGVASDDDKAMPGTHPCLHIAQQSLFIGVFVWVEDYVDVQSGVPSTQHLLRQVGGHVE